MFKHVSDSHRIILATKVPHDFSSSDIVAAFSSFGKITDTLSLQSKQQAFIEFESADSAKKCVETYKGPMRLYFSNKSQLVHKEEPMASRVLHISFDKLKYPLIADLLLTAFMPYGDVHKVLICTDKGANYALAEMDSVESAARVKESLNGQSLFSDGNRMAIGYSKLQELEVKEQSDRCRDYTVPFNENVGVEEGLSAQELLEEFKAKMEGLESGGEGSRRAEAKNLPGNSIEPTTVLFLQNVSKEVTVMNLFTLFGCFGNVDAIRLLESKPGAALVQMSSKEEANTAKAQLNGCSLRGQELSVSGAKVKEIYRTKGTAEFKDSKGKRYYKPGSKNCSNVAVVCMCLRSRLVKFCMCRIFPKEALKMMSKTHSKVLAILTHLCFIRMIRQWGMQNLSRKMMQCMPW
eukprot:TRINITY_DN11784_c0_g5_i1.p1 TRINITY_DN11784_c0_g5~~TRINITY_DN11784_c0_g5_i1.p1  ORF type:complete len:407 (+),score=78.44 TRINITY_DN11784_c0_g5_i1:1-1221(+)